MYFQYDMSRLRRLQKGLFVAFASMALLGCHMDGPQVTGPKREPVVLKGLTMDQVPDGWQCNSSLPIGETVDRRNGLTMWKVGVFDGQESIQFPVLLYAVGKNPKSCKFYFVKTDPDMGFSEPVVYPFEPAIYAPFDAFLQNLMAEKIRLCKLNTHSEHQEKCEVGVMDKLVKSASEITSTRLVGEFNIAKTYLFINGEVFNEQGNKI